MGLTSSSMASAECPVRRRCPCSEQERNSRAVGYIIRCRTCYKASPVLPLFCNEANDEKCNNDRAPNSRNSDCIPAFALSFLGRRENALVPAAVIGDNEGLNLGQSSSHWQHQHHQQQSPSEAGMHSPVDEQGDDSIAITMSLSSLTDESNAPLILRCTDDLSGFYTTDFLFDQHPSFLPALEKLYCGSGIFDSERKKSFFGSIQIFQRNELVCVSGKFGDVAGVSEIHRSHSSYLKDDKNITTGYIYNGINSQYALKAVQRDSMTQDTDSYLFAARDLAIEVHFLSVLEHPNIIKLRGIAIDDTSGYPFSLVLDGLDGKLEGLIEEWQRRTTRLKPSSRKFRGKTARKLEKAKLIEEKIKVASDLAAALSYLHAKCIMHRDLKPDNIGFDSYGDLKLFDFTLAKELKRIDHFAYDLYNLTGCCGSLCYMAPEVFSCKPYNSSADIYSFGLVLWQILSLKTPFPKYDKDTYENLVLKQRRRPVIDSIWPSSLQNLIELSWSDFYLNRPSSLTVMDTLKKQLKELRGVGALRI